MLLIGPLSSHISVSALTDPPASLTLSGAQIIQGPD
jgi:hypothetical protein